MMITSAGIRGQERRSFMSLLMVLVVGWISSLLGIFSFGEVWSGEKKFRVIW